MAASRPWLSAFASLVFASGAQAHAGLGPDHGHGLTSFAAGALHPISGLDHLLAMIAVGLWSALSVGAKDVRGWRLGLSPMWLPLISPLSFAVALLIGALAALGGLGLPGIEPMIATSLLVFGLLVVSPARLPAGAGAALVASFAVFHGLAHGQELGGHGATALAGMMMTTAALHAVGLRAGFALKGRPRWLSRLAGGVVALLGLTQLGTAFAATL